MRATIILTDDKEKPSEHMLQIRTLNMKVIHIILHDKTNSAFQLTIL